MARVQTKIESVSIPNLISPELEAQRMPQSRVKVDSHLCQVSYKSTRWTQNASSSRLTELLTFTQGDFLALPPQKPTH